MVIAWLSKWRGVLLKDYPKISKRQNRFSSRLSRSNADKLTENKRRVHCVKSSQHSFENLLKLFEQGDLRERASTIQKIGFLDSADDSVINFLKDCTNDEDFRIRANALEALDQLEPYTDTEVLLKCLKDEHNRGDWKCVLLYTILIIGIFLPISMEP